MSILEAYMLPGFTLIEKEKPPDGALAICLCQDISWNPVRVRKTTYRGTEHYHYILPGNQQTEIYNVIAWRQIEKWGDENPIMREFKDTPFCKAVDQLERIRHSLQFSAEEHPPELLDLIESMTHLGEGPYDDED